MNSRQLLAIAVWALLHTASAWGQSGHRDTLDLGARIAELERQNSELRTALERQAAAPFDATRPRTKYVTAGSVTSETHESWGFRSWMWVAAAGLLMLALSHRPARRASISRASIPSNANLRIWPPSQS